MVSAPSYLLHSQKQVYKLIGKCQTHSRLAEHTLTLPASQADKRIGSLRENKRNREGTIDGRDRNDTAKMRQREEEVEVGMTEQDEEIEVEMEIETGGNL